MRILYVAFGNNPAVETILGGMHDETLSGLPAFYYPFKMLLARGCTIDLLLYSSEPKTVVESAHFRTRQCLRARHYDFVYGMTEGSHMAVRTAAHMGIPCALRQFGTQEMANVLETIPSGWRRQLRALKDYTYITLSMRSRKNFLLATNDGSRADALYDILGVDRKKFAFYFWRSAVDIPAQQPVVDMDAQGSYPQVFQPLCLSHIGRIADVKRQDRSEQRGHVPGVSGRGGRIRRCGLCAHDRQPAAERLPAVCAQRACHAAARRMEPREHLLRGHG